MDPLGQFLAILVAVLALITSFCGLFVIVRGSYGKAQIQVLREDNETLRNSRDDLKIENEHLKKVIERQARDRRS